MKRHKAYAQKAASCSIRCTGIYQKHTQNKHILIMLLCNVFECNFLGKISHVSVYKICGAASFEHSDAKKYLKTYTIFKMLKTTNIKKIDLTVLLL